ncbi:cation:proton antiporter [Synechococcus sp. JJ3a-Johnson]|jgi:cell volume regulation protein A|uniref:cation:proton antiporter domain-containing protein n=1 Tax=Synechococcus sp. JJ3a-Johnson TaxID=2823738 RepID=UPI0020CE4D72|nr:cation:proton antiporter [Synechococcus sp. JJ3a-Johnson]MCP9831405.1 cation:proton antiporter [Synechococcus sp. JJ3a-Johnson]
MTATSGVAVLILLTTPPEGPAYLAGTLLPRGFFLGLGLMYLAALAVDRLAAGWRLPGAAAVLLLGLAIPSDLLARTEPLAPLQLETLHRVSLALLLFYAGLRTNLRRIHGMKAAGLRLGTLGLLITVLIAGLALWLLAPGLPGGLPPSVVWLVVCCLAATDSGALEDLLVALRHSVSGRLSHLLEFEAALSTVMALLCFGFVAAILQVQAHGDHQSLHAALTSRLPEQLGALALHVLAGMVAGVAVGGLAPRLIDRLVRSDQQLLLVAVALAFVAFGFGQLLGGGGLLAVFLAGVCLSNGRYRIDRFEQQALGRVMQPFNTAAELTVLLLLGLMVQPEALGSVLPVGLGLALVLPLARLVGVWLVLRPPAFPRGDRLIVAGCGMRAAVPLALTVSLTEELPHLRGITAAAVEPLADQLLALVFVVVLIDLVLQPLAMRQLLHAIAAPRPSA